MLFTSEYDEEDKRKFSYSTPKRVSSAYHRILDPVTGVAPTSDRMLHDIDLVFLSMKKIHDDKGVKDLTLAKRSGHRWEPSKEERRGGKRTKKQWVDFVLHRDAVEGRKVKIEISRERFRGVKAIKNGEDASPVLLLKN